jgi:hypothetical protein
MSYAVIPVRSMRGRIDRRFVPTLPGRGGGLGYVFGSGILVQDSNQFVSPSCAGATICTDYSSGSPVWWPNWLRAAKPAEFAARWQEAGYGQMAITPYGVFPSGNYLPMVGTTAWVGQLAASGNQWAADNLAANAAQATYAAQQLANSPAPTQAMLDAQWALVQSRLAASPGGTSGGGTGGSGGGGGSITPPSPSSSWFTEEMISGLPNWILVAGGAVAGVMISRGKH